MTNTLEELHSVALSSIDLEDSAFRITTQAEIHELVAAIQQLGLLHPPTLKRDGTGFRIVSGFRRIASCRQIGWSEVPAFILGPEIPDRACALHAIADNSLQRKLNLVEISRALFLLSSYFKDEKLKLKYASLLGLSEHHTHFKKIEKICYFPKQIQDSILSGTISLAVAMDLSEFDTDTGEQLIKLFERLGIGLNKQRQLILLFREIALREGTTIQDLLGEKEVLKILDSTELDRVQKSRKIKSFLHQRRFPTITRTEREFEKQIKKLKLGKSVTITPPRDFEGTTYTLTMRFSSHTELREQQSKLDRIVRSAGLKKFLNGIKK